MTLTTYARKRNFKKTAEPGPRMAPKAGHSFVIQKHDASHLHYDFRLELGGVLKSWAVPKGLSLDPADKRLAVEVEDHPVAYGTFEGTIPEGEYGGGTVLLWDRGTWSTDEPDPAAALERGKLTFNLAGEKLQGGWTLARMHGRGSGGKNNWLIIKQHDDHERPGASIVDERPESVKTGRDLEAIAAGDDVWTSGGASKRAKKVDKQSPRAAAEARSASASSGTASRAKKAGKETSRPQQQSPAPNSRARQAAKSASLRTQSKTRAPDVSSAKSNPTPASKRKTSWNKSSTRKTSSRVKTPALAAPEVDPAAIPLARRAPFPSNLPPQLCTPAEHAPGGEGWVHEVKFDGYRFLAYISGGSARLITRGGKDWTAKFPGIAHELAQLPVETAIIDGEACVVDSHGRSSFQKLQGAIKDPASHQVHLFAFDLLYLDGHDLTRATLLDRKAALAAIIAGGARDIVRYSDHSVGEGDRLFEQACKLGLEGIVSKRADSPYITARTTSWLKIKCGHRQEFIIIGHTPPQRSRKHFGSLLLAAHNDQGKLVYTGHVGTGFSDAFLGELMARMKPLARTKSPLDIPAPSTEVRGARWITPSLVAEIAFTEWTDDGRLRHPAFKGMREDKDAKLVKIEHPVDPAVATDARRSSPPRGPGRVAKARAPRPRSGAEPSAPESFQSPAPPTRKTKAPAASRPSANSRGKSAPAPGGPPVLSGVTITSPTRVVFPDNGLTKLDLARYYDAVAERMLPYIQNRPLSTLRCPEGRKGSCFFQKHTAATFHEPVKSVRIEESSGLADYITIDSRAGLVALIQYGVIEIHPWGSRNDLPDRPDMITIDLDPGEGTTFNDVKAGATLARAILTAAGLTSFLKTSGGKGLHIVVPFDRRVEWDHAKAFAHSVALKMEREQPRKYLSTMSKQQRVGRIFVDYLRNGRGATSVAAYSVRAREGAPISMPLAWKDLPGLTSANQFTVNTWMASKDARRADPWKDFFTTRQKLPASVG